MDKRAHNYSHSDKDLERAVEEYQDWELEHAEIPFTLGYAKVHEKSLDVGIMLLEKDNRLRHELARLKRKLYNVTYQAGAGKLPCAKCAYKGKSQCILPCTTDPRCYYAPRAPNEIPTSMRGSLHPDNLKQQYNNVESTCNEFQYRGSLWEEDMRAQHLGANHSYGTSAKKNPGELRGSLYEEDMCRSNAARRKHVYPTDSYFSVGSQPPKHSQERRPKPVGQFPESQQNAHGYYRDPPEQLPQQGGTYHQKTHQTPHNTHQLATVPVTGQSADGTRLKTLYDILGIPENASKKHIKLSYMKLVRDAHPDQNSHEWAKDLTQQLNTAYEWLSDDNKRLFYNLTGSTSELRYEDWRNNQARRQGGSAW
ncbi:hypothetical protein M011DRAFT_529330 [Sporormia fimetaria CBS 119925]|uniref:J domain-containing protein n=1 Tax=Sporormia fimetaria CBS 119925 TaxID=1340428 RepID=A0A6A6V0T3_9PLEO|nr:hypothetical protein M011DRAFT_529330 [Sporormia fimetaria CBS 119925]